MSRPRVPQATGLSRIAISTRPSAPRRRMSSAMAMITKKTSIVNT